jgi:hypothetical protein
MDYSPVIVFRYLTATGTSVMLRLASPMVGSVLWPISAFELLHGKVNQSAVLQLLDSVSSPASIRVKAARDYSAQATRPLSLDAAAADQPPAFLTLACAVSGLRSRRFAIRAFRTWGSAIYEQAVRYC